MTRKLVLFAVAVVCLWAASAHAEQAVLQGLDKVTARVSTFVAPIGQVVGFGTLQVTARTCKKKPPEEPPNTAAYLDIDDVRPGNPMPVQLFSGWMFASSPALNALQHPVYDVWLVDCK